jgi:hypothetical protein
LAGGNPISVKADFRVGARVRKYAAIIFQDSDLKWMILGMNYLLGIMRGDKCIELISVHPRDAGTAFKMMQER